MKMSMSLFWGLLLILIGISLILKVVFHVDIPVFKVLIAFFFIYIGIKILTGGSFKVFQTHRDENSIVFGETVFREVVDQREYNVIFSKSTFDLREMQLDSTKNTRIKINTVFGATDFFLNNDVPVSVRANAAFAGVDLPDGNASAFGSAFYQSDSAKVASTVLELEVNTVFGAFKMRRR
jgi:predicted membrane protein